MISTAITREEYLESIPADKKKSFIELRKVVKKNLPNGFKECMYCGMLGYVVPHSIYPKGYHCDPKVPLPFMSIAAQKNFIALYHMGLYGDPKLLDWFKKEYSKQVTSKLDMGKSCVRFKKPEEIPFKLIAELCSKITVEKWIACVEKALSKMK